jgi:4,5-DOPA dioxygenase extradiol
MLAIQDSPARKFLLQLGQTLPKPVAILVISAHWESSDRPAVSLASHPETIHDFGGFPQALFDIRYRATGAPDTAAKAATLLEQAGIPAEQSPARGLDHGAWVPLSLMYPDADVPVTQLSLIRDASPAAHDQIGKALSPLRDDNVLIIGSGSLTHNLYEFRGQAIDADVPSWVSEFDLWMKARLEDNRRDELLDYRTLAPFAERNHPTEEHLLPLFVAMGAAGYGAKAQQLHGSYEYGVLAMDMYAFS